MTPEDRFQLQQCVDTIAIILYRNAPAEQLQTLKGIEQAIRTHMQLRRDVLPRMGVPLLQQRLAQLTDTSKR